MNYVGNDSVKESMVMGYYEESVWLVLLIKYSYVLYWFWDLCISKSIIL